MTTKQKKATIDWVTYKAEFFQSNEVRVADFLRRKLNIEAPSAFHKRKTKGWTEEKKKLMESSLEEAKKDLQDKIKSAYDIPVGRLQQLKKNIFDIILARLSQISDKVQIQVNPQTGEKKILVSWEIPTKELVEILKVVKTELWEPTNINQSQLWDEEKEIYKEYATITIK